MQTPSHLKLEIRTGVAILSVSRPEALNALNRGLVDELEKRFEELAIDDLVRAVVLQGAGDKAFVAGADIRELMNLGPAEALAFSRRGQEVFNRIANLGKPVIAAVNGYCLGGGCELAMACHLRVASENAKFGQPEVGLGLIPGYGGTQRLGRLVGQGRALELILSGEMIPAQRAWEIGLVNQVVPSEQLLEAAVDLARKILSKSPVAVGYAMRAVCKGADLPIETAFELESSLFALCFGTEDMKEGTAAFVERRSPVFPGK